jgi:hypothetical protein
MTPSNVCFSGAKVIAFAARHCRARAIVPPSGRHDHLPDFLGFLWRGDINRYDTSTVNQAICRASQVVGSSHWQLKPRSVGLFATRALIEKRVPSMQEAAVAASAVSGAVASVALVET